MTTKSLYPKNMYFSEPPKNIVIQNFEPPKMGQAYVYEVILRGKYLGPPGFESRTPA